MVFEQIFFDFLFKELAEVAGFTNRQYCPITNAKLVYLNPDSLSDCLTSGGFLLAFQLRVDLQEDVFFILVVERAQCFFFCVFVLSTFSDKYSFIIF